MPIVVAAPNGASKMSDMNNGPATKVMKSEVVVEFCVTYVASRTVKQSSTIELVMAIDEYAVHDPSWQGAEGSKTNDPVRVPPSLSFTSSKM
jgi:hypothetical protein